MRFEGDQLRAILAYQTEPVVVRDGFGRPEVEYENPRAALTILRRGNYYGVGHAKRIRFVQPDSVEDQVVPWGAEVDFSAPCGAEFQYISVRAGRPKRKCNGAKRSKVMRPDRLTKAAITVVVDAPLFRSWIKLPKDPNALCDRWSVGSPTDPKTHIGFTGAHHWQISPGMISAVAEHGPVAPAPRTVTRCMEGYSVLESYRKAAEARKTKCAELAESFE